MNQSKIDDGINKRTQFIIMETLFTEKQRFRQWWILLLLAVTTGIMVDGIIQGNNSSPDIGLIISMLIPIGVMFLVYKMCLVTSITKSGISFQLKPFKFHHLDWTEIDKAYVRTYSPILEYGGWGYRISRKGRAYNIRGKEGLQLELKNGQKILIGTQKTAELKKVLKTLSL